MSGNSKKCHGGAGQALAEFALIIIVVLMMMFIILEAGRVLWAWVTVQGAARDGARYAVTGQEGCEAGYDRVDCVITTTYRSLSALPLNQNPDAAFEEDNYYLIEVFGVDDSGQLQPDFAGTPGQPMIVRVIYRVPIVTPFFRPIRQSISVFGQVTMNNEQWGSLGGATAGVGLPPPLPELPTPGVTPSPTATPTEGPSPSPTATNTATATPTATRCPTQFDGVLVQDETIAGVTGELDSQVSLFDMSVTATPGLPRFIGSAILIDRDGHACDGYLDVSVSPPLVGGHTILVRNDEPGDGSSDVAIVLTGTPTPTPSPTNTPAPTNTPTNTPTIAPTATPSGPFLALFPTCGFGPDVTINVQGYNFPSGSINLFWRLEGQSPAFQGTANGPSFNQQWDLFGVPDGVHQVRASAGGSTYTANFRVPCPNMTATPPANTPTPTPAPADLIISGPVLVSTPPIVEYRPLQFEYVISNIGDEDVDTQFFTDAYIDPPPAEVGEDAIDVAFSDGYQASSALAAGATRVIKINVPLGFTGGLEGTRTVYGMVDSLLQIDEGDETNNLTDPLFVDDVTPAPSPTPTATPSGSESISGQVMAYIGNWSPQHRARVWLVDTDTGTVSAGPLQTEYDGRYGFNAVSDGTYSLVGCIVVDGLEYVGTRPGVLPGDVFADIFMEASAVGCPYRP